MLHLFILRTYEWPYCEHTVSFRGENLLLINHID